MTLNALPDGSKSTHAHCGGDASDAFANGDVAARAMITAADACTISATRGSDGAATYGDVTARAIIAAADARTKIATLGSDGAAADGDVTARAFIAAAYAST